MHHRHRALLATAFAALLAAPVWAAEKSAEPAADLTAGMKKGTPDLKSAGPLAFGPQGILFVGDPRGAAIFAIDTGERTAPAKGGRPNVEGINEKVASMLGVEAEDVAIHDLAVNPVARSTYLSVSRGRGPSGKPVLVRVGPDGKLAAVALKGVRFAKAEIPNAAEGRGRQEAITDLAYLKGRLLVAGLSNEEFASKLRVIPFPFKKVDEGASVEIFHGSHGKLETRSPVRVFVPYRIKGEDHLLAAYTCTPLVKVPVSDLKPGSKVRGVTVAELGNRNRPLSMIVYNKGGKDYVLMANSSRGLMKIPLEGVDTIKGITSHVRDKAGLKYETVEDLKGVQKVDAFDLGHAVVLLRTPGGALNLQTVPLP
jgi:hypothetical protein